jgi:hypothetical protein
MAGLRPGHPRLSYFNHRQDVDARHKAGHDGHSISGCRRSLRPFGANDRRCCSPKPGPAAALAFDDLVALFEQALAFAILALRLLLDVGTSFIGHDILSRMLFAYSHEGRILDYKQDLFDVRTAMITRRHFALAGLLTAPLAGAVVPRARAAQPSAAPAQNDPVAILTAIYTRVAKGKGNSGGGFVIEDKAAKAKYLSKSLVDLWARADANTKKGDAGPIDFDPVTNSEEPDVKSFKVAAEKIEADSALIAVTLTSRMARAKASDDIVRYKFVREDGRWKIDDISGTLDGEAWSIRDILSESLRDVA